MKLWAVPRRTIETADQGFEGSSVNKDPSVGKSVATWEFWGTSPPMVKSQVAEDILPGGQARQSFPGEVQTSGGGQDSDHTSTSKIL